MRWDGESKSVCDGLDGVNDSVIAIAWRKNIKPQQFRIVIRSSIHNVYTMLQICLPLLIGMEF